MKRKMLYMVTFSLAGLLFLSGLAYSHCDTLDGPVVMTAKKALEKGDVTPVLKWVKKEDEKEIREMFKKTLAVRSLNTDAKEMADMYFLETLVRLHRADEGQPYTGLKPVGEVDVAITQADKSLETGSVDELVKTISAEVDTGIRKRFEHALEKKKDVNKSIDAGREYVEAYVVFLHYVEGIYNAAKSEGGGHHHEALPQEGAKSGHHFK